MKKFTFIIIILITGFFASPYIIDHFQWKSALRTVRATGAGISVYEGVKSSLITVCQCVPTVPPVPPCTIGCFSPTNTMCTSAIPPKCMLYSGMTVTLSAGGLPCATGYLLDTAQASMLQGSTNAIIAGTICTKLSLIATGKGCMGCTAKINDPKVYAYKNKVKEIINFIIAGNKDN